MAIDPNVPGMAAVRFNNPFEVLGQMQDLRLRQQAIQTNQALEESRRQDIAKQARDEAAQQTFLKVLSESPDPVQAAERIRVQAPQYFQAYSKALTEQQAKAEEMRKTKIEAAKVQAEVQQKAFDYGAPLMQFVEQAKFSPEAFAFAMRTWTHDFPDFKDTAEALLQRVAQGGPEEIQRIVTGFKTTQQQQADTSRGTAQAELPGKVAQSEMQGQIAENMQGGLTAEQRTQHTETARHNRESEAESRAAGQRAAAGAPVQVMGPEGKPIWVRASDAIGQPAAQAARAVTGQERQTLAYYNRAKEASDTVVPLEDAIGKKSVAGQARLEYAPNWLQSPENQSYRQAQRAFTEARLRKESGAAIPTAEYTNDSRTYFAQPGDTPTLLEQKRKARQTVLDGLAFSAGKAYEEYYGESRPKGGAAADAVEEWVRDPKTGRLVRKP